MTRTSEAAATFLESTSVSTESLNQEALINIELSKIRKRYEQSKISNYMVLTKVSSQNSASERYAKWSAIHQFILELGGSALLDEYYAAAPQSPYNGGFEYTEQQIQAGEAHQSTRHLWYVVFRYPSDGCLFEVKHMPGEDDRGWAYRLAVRR